MRRCAKSPMAVRGFLSFVLLVISFLPPSAAREQAPSNKKDLSAPKSGRITAGPSESEPAGVSGTATAGVSSRRADTGGDASFLRRSLVKLWKPPAMEETASTTRPQQEPTHTGTEASAAGTDTVAGTGARTATPAASHAAAPYTKGRVYAADATVLLKAKAGWLGAPGTVDTQHYLATWDAKKPCQSWQGLDCNNTTGRVISVSLPGKSGFRLAGKVPSELGSLAALQTLVLTAHALRGPIPRQLGSLLRLTTLDLSGNAFGDTTVPRDVGNMTSLKYLDLSSSGLSGSFPDEVARLIRLTHLDLSGNALRGAIPPQLGNLVRLQHLLLDNNRISGSLPESLSKVANVEVLDAHGNLLSGSLPESFRALKKLYYLSVAENSLSGTLGAGLSALGRGQLRIHDNRITGSIPSTLWYLNLIADNNRLTGQLPTTFLTHNFAGSFSGNFLTGGCPYFNSSVGLCSPRGSECPYVLQAIKNTLVNNCLKHCVIAPKVGATQKPPAACARACGSDAHGGACYNEGSCEFEGPNQAPTCHCDTSTPITNPYYNPGTCVPDRSPNDPPPLPTRNFPKGISFTQAPAPLAHLNKWSRFLSRGSHQQRQGQGQLGVVWRLPSALSWGNEYPVAPLTWSPVLDQGNCSCSWATAAVEAIAAASRLASSKSGGQVPVLSVSQVLRCSGGGKSGRCKGDVPATALEYTAGTGVLADNSFKGNKTCASVSKVPPSIVMYEAVRFRGYLGIILLLQSQPALVVIEASRAFQRAPCYDNTLVFQDAGCYTGSLDHTVLVVGYNFGAGVPSFLVRNSWGSGWCKGGYINMAIQGGPGVCGMNVLPAYYPIAAPSKGDPCYSKSTVVNGTSGPSHVLNPCGGGQCTPEPAWGSYGYRCKCPPGFVAVNNTVRVTLPGAGKGVTQACAPIDACTATIDNPCGVGSCVNDRKGGYSCLCPPGTHEGKFVDGQPTCSFGQGPKTLTVKPGVTCCLISATFQIPLQQLKKQNPKLNCNKLMPGTVLQISNSSYSCSSTYTVTSKYRTFQDISKFVLWPLARSSIHEEWTAPVQIKSLNPTASCGDLVPGQSICLKRGQWVRRVCSLRYAMQAGETCQSMTGRFFRKPREGIYMGPSVTERDPMPFFQMNPGINCDLLAGAGESGNASSFIGAQGVSICISTSPPPTYGKSTPCPEALVEYYLKQGDSCIGMAAQKTRFHFQSVKHIEALNFPVSGLSCSERLKVGQLVCHPRG